MVLQKALSFMASITPKASAASAAKDLELQTPRNGARTQEAPARLEGTGSCRAEPKRNQQEMELDDFDGGLEEEEEKTQSYESEDEDGGQVLKSELIEISLGGDEHHHSQKGPHQNGPHHVHHHHHDVRHYHSASDLETIDELIDFAKDGDLFNFRRVCETLTKRSVSPDSPGYMGWTPAHWAAREGHVHILDYLLNAGVSLDALDRKGDSLLHKAAANGQYRACQWLLQFGFNVQAKNNNGKSALDVAQEHLALAKTSEAALCEAILARENANTF